MDQFAFDFEVVTEATELGPAVPPRFHRHTTPRPSTQSIQW
jgi:hypothetical protein